MKWLVSPPRFVLVVESSCPLFCSFNQDFAKDFFHCQFGQCLIHYSYGNLLVIPGYKWDYTYIL